MLLRWWRPPAVSDNSEATALPTTELKSQAASYNELETRARGLDQRWSNGDPFLERESYDEEREELRSEIRSCRHAVRLDDKAPATPVDLFLSSGHEDNPWANGVACARDALGPALLATALMLWISWQDNRWKLILDGWLGPAQLTLNITGELII
jgi:hypothetical protein